jgi:hypothetical protein
LFNLQLKAYDKFKGEFLFWKKVKTANSALMVFINDAGTNRKGWIEVIEHPKRFVLCFGLGQTDKNGVDLYSSDIILNEENELGTITYSKNRGGFFVKYNGKLKFIATSKVKKVGDIFHVTNKVKEKVNAHQ